MSDYVLSVRDVRAGAFGIGTGPSRFLEIPDGQDVSPAQAISRTGWYGAVRKAAEWTNEDGKPRGDILFFVHGYNVSVAEMIERHRLIRDGLKTLGFKGVVVSFDWPSDDQALAYLTDRHRAKETAMQLVSDGIVYLSKAQGPNCTINVHVLAHSTGAYVVREAFDDADDHKLENGAWSVSQLLFIAGDVSVSSMSASDRGADSIYLHCVRLTNYANRHDEVLDISNVKRVGLAPRVGRRGLPPDAPAKAVNIECTDYFGKFDADPAISKSDSPQGIKGVKSHSWFFGNTVFTQDLFLTLIGTDRTVIPTRGRATDGQLVLQRPAT